MSDLTLSDYRNAALASARQVDALYMRIRKLEAELRWIHETSRKSLFERTHRSAAKAALEALSEINHRIAPYK